MLFFVLFRLPSTPCFWQLAVAYILFFSVYIQRFVFSNLLSLTFSFFRWTSAPSFLQLNVPLLHLSQAVFASDFLTI
jgi:hypothetical protein